MKLSKLFVEFFESEKAGGLLLIIATLISLLIANSVIQTEYIGLWNYDLGGHTIVQWINDGLMTIFFLLIGLELEREVYQGEFSNFKSASLPIFGALGGMMFPALIFLYFNFGTSSQNGAGIPMATDIAFAIGILSLLGSRVPNSLKMFLTGIAIIDDLGAIIMIALFYTQSLNLISFFIAIGIFVFLVILNRIKVHNLIPYLFAGVFMWYFMLDSGVHATIAGVLLALAIPFGDGKEKSPSYKLQHFLHKPIAFVVLPIFALANTSISIGDQWHVSLFESNGLGIMLGLLLGKPLGVWLFCLIAVSFGISKLPKGLNWSSIIGVGLLAGIGFTMSMFITVLAFEDASMVIDSKIAILVASTVAAIIGYFFLRFSLSPNSVNEDEA
jgi:Na+:H+ antiporter, NhaA family